MFLDVSLTFSTVVSTLYELKLCHLFIWPPLRYSARNVAKAIFLILKSELIIFKRIFVLLLGVANCLADGVFVVVF